MKERTNMKTWIGLALTVLTFLAGCAPGYYEKGPAYQASSPTYSGMTYTNPETTEQYERRIWWESIHR
jgi:hypothetical protein